MYDTIRARRSALLASIGAAALVLAAACADLSAAPALRDPGSGAAASGVVDGWLPDGAKRPAGVPRVAGSSARVLVPGDTVTLTGTDLDAGGEDFAVRIGGVPARVLRRTTDRLTAVVPCLPSGEVEVEVEAEGLAGTALILPLRAPARALAPASAAILAEAGEAACVELVPAGEEARYVIAVYNAATLPSATVAFELSGAPEGTGPAAVRETRSAHPAPSPTGTASPEAEALRRGDAWHASLLEHNEREYARLFRRFSGDPRMRPRHDAAAFSAEPPLHRTIRVADASTREVCLHHYTASATRVYYAGRLAIYEDDATPEALRAANNPRMAAYYRAIGDQFNEDMEPVVRGYFGDPLVRDLDGNGVLVAFFTPLVNEHFPGLAGFVVSCDQFPTDPVDNPTSNFGEFFYAMQPVRDEAGFATGTPDAWYRTIRATFVHETKHVASHAARAAGASPTWEASWLEEGTARLAEELWARNAIYGVAWKGGTGYGGPEAPGSIYCDTRPTDAACTASNPRRPSLNLWRHFQTNALYWWMGNSRTSSPFGRTAADNAGGASSAFYATSWSLVRYAVDRYATSEAAFLTALTGSGASGAANLAARAGVPIEVILGGWALSLYVGVDSAATELSADVRFPTWDLRSIYAGLAADAPAGYSRPSPIPATALPIGDFATQRVTGLAGGGVAYFELSGSQFGAQLLRLTGADGGPPPATVRMAVARLR